MCETTVLLCIACHIFLHFFKMTLLYSSQDIGDPTQRGQSCQEGQAMCSAGDQHL